ncbi:RNA polymerase sigma-70 factor [Polluticoccus soli]|uniref:RNA polymerase sigma-70 factor n=1 Tax=Polluticoccus soli TaxID=3034150 RepID=UPI0023E102CB|nr:RNA polymerase sigma-70 factor [Flavipsychrobacter sp. JY13-12]
MKEAVIFALGHPFIRMENESAGIQLIDVGSEVIFERTFKSHFKALHAYACTILRSEAMAEEAVQNVFYKLWEKKDQINIKESLSAYLYRAVYHECLNMMKHSKVKDAYKAHTTYLHTDIEKANERTSLKELETKLADALKDLPEQCRTIFQMSRFEELKYREIAEQLGLSVKTVENQMGKALRILREKLADFLPMIILFPHLLNMLS